MMQRLIVTLSTLICLLVSLAWPCQAQQIYACVNSSDGTLRIVQPPPNPPTCKKSETLLSWSQVGPQGPQGPAGPAGAVGPQGPPGESSSPLHIDVNCNQGETVAEALAQGAGRWALGITIQGECKEHVNIDRANVTLEGASTDDKLIAPSNAPFALGIGSGQHVTLRHLTLQGGEFGLSVGQGTVWGEDVHITGATFGINIWAGTVFLVNSLIENSVGSNISIAPGGQLILWSSEVKNGHFGGISVTGGSAWLSQVTVQGHDASGIMASNGAHLQIENSQIIGNAKAGIFLRGGYLNIGHSTIASNSQMGISMAGGTVDLQGATIEKNGYSGIQAVLGSRITLESNVIIRMNGVNGIELEDTSVVGADSTDGIQITKNNGTGILCKPAPSVAQISRYFTPGGFSINGNQVFDNIGPYQINCPGMVVPTPPGTVK